MGDLMKDDEKKTKKQLLDELTELRSQNAALKKTNGNIASELVMQEATRYAESIVETVREPLLILDANLKIISANRNFYTTFKVNPANTIGRFIYDLGNRQWDIPKLRELLENILPKKEVFNGFEVEHTFHNIGHKIMLLNARQIYRADINSKIILLAIEDITERRSIEEKLLLATIVESSKDAIIGESLDGIITSWNKGAEEIYGYTKSEIIGKSISVIVPPRLPDELTDILSKIKLGEAIKSYETIRRRKDGQNIYVSLSVSAVYDAEGRILGASTIARDITERKQLENLLKESEMQYRLLFETANDGIVLLEKSEGKIAHINPSVEKMLGYSAKEVIGNKLQDVGLIIDHGDFQITMKNLNKRGILRYNDVPVKTKSGKQIYADTYLVDKAKFAQCNIRDITERRSKEKEIRLLNEDLEKRILQRTAQLNEANKELASFAYSVSHDLRAPLRGIDGWSLALLEEYGDTLDDQGRKYLQRVRTETQQMGMLIEDLLNLSRITRIEPQLMPIDLTAMASSIANRLQEENPQRNIEFIIQPALRANGDNHLINIVLTNLFDNAVKFTGKQFLPRIEFGKTEVDGGKAFFVRDNGAGFDMAHAPKLFGAFQRLHKSSEFPGTGIGLATVQRIIHRHGGRIWANAQIDQGATFYFTL
jgi:PAS domain S-box-containing protein